MEIRTASMSAILRDVDFDLRFFPIAQATSNGDSPLTDCNFHSIASTCYSFNHRRMIYEDRLEVRRAAQQQVSISTQQWISRNELPQAVADYIINNTM